MAENIPTAGETTVPQGDSPREKKKIVLVDVSENFKERARDIGEARMTHSQEELSGVKGFFAKIWKHNLFNEYYRQKEIGRAQKELEAGNNLFVDEVAGQELHNKAMISIVKQFSSDYDEAIHKESGEMREVLADTPRDRQVQADTQALVREFATRDLSDPDVLESFNRRKEDIFAGVGSKNHKTPGTERRYADNLLEITKEIQLNIKHGAGLKALDEDFEIIIGKAKSGVRTEAQFNAVDRITDKIHASKLGRFVNEATTGAAVSIAYSVAVGAFQRAASSRLATWGTFGASALLAGGISGLRESRKMEMERRQHFREMASGKTFDENKAERRKEFEEARYETRLAPDITRSLEAKLYNEKKELKPLSAEEFRDALSELTDIEARIAMSDRKKIDLISFSSVANIAEERLDLDVARARAKVELRRLVAENPSLRESLGGKELDAFLAESAAAQNIALTEGEGGIEEKDRIFKKLKHREVGKAVARGVLTGLVVGGIAQEVGAFFRDDQMGIVKKLFSNSQAMPHATVLEGFRQWMVGLYASENLANLHEVEVGSAHYRLPEGMEFVKNPLGSYTLMQGSESVADNIVLSPDGHLSRIAEESLAESGLHISTSHVPVATAFAHDAMLGQHSAGAPHPEATSIHRSLWYDNDTPKPVFDKNELKLWWGGHHGSGIDTKGNFVYDVKHMAADGSYHKEFSADAHKLMEEGKLKLVISASRETENQVFSVPIDKNGNALVDPKSWIGKTFFKVENGHAVFQGKFAEVAEVVGNKNGVENLRILATQVGHGVEQGIVTNEPPINIFEVPPMPIIDPPPVIPVFGRKPLESLETAAVPSGQEVIPSYGYGYGQSGELGLLSREKYNGRMLPALRENRELDVSREDGALITEYLAAQDPSYRAELDQMIENEPAMRPETKLVITVPAYKEGENIEKTIREYAKLKTLGDTHAFELVILENHPEDTARDKTGEVIERMKKEYPDLNLVHLYKKFPQKPAIGEVRKYLVDAILARKQKAGIGRSLILASHDADTEGMSDQYAKHLIRAFENDAKLDAVGAKWDYPRETFVQMPHLHAAMRLWQFFDIAFRKNYLKSPDLIGRNSAFRSGIYAGIGGYNKDAKVAEDLEIGWLIKNARGNSANRTRYLNDAWLVSNPRRGVANTMSGRKVVEMYSDFHQNESVRELSVSELLAQGKPFTKDDFEKEAQGVYDFYHRFVSSKEGGWVPDEYVERSFRRAMGFLGVSYTIEKDKVSITDTSKLERGLRAYQTPGAAMGRVPRTA